MTDEDTMPWGKHKGKKMKEVPANYLDWLDGQKWIEDWPDIFSYIRQNRELIDKELRQQGLI